MADLVPTGSRIDREALERIIHRAAELQAGEREIGEGLTDTELMQLGDDVGIPAAYLRQALLEERTRSALTAETGFRAWLAGPSRVAAGRTLPREAAQVEDALHYWMSEGELLVVKRRYPDRTTWEPKSGAFASLKRSFRAGGRDYHLSRSREVDGRITALEAGRCHVQLIADLSNSQRERVNGATTMAVMGGAASGLALLLGVTLLVAAAPVPIAAAVAFSIGRSRLREVERAQVALEQVLDRLEHGEIQVPRQVPGPRPSAFGRIADELRKQLGA